MPVPRTQDQRITGVVVQTVPNEYQSIGAGPSVTVDVGPSRKVKLDFGARFILDTGSSATTLVQLQVSMSGNNTGEVGGNNAEGRNTPQGYSQTLATAYMVEVDNPGLTTFTLQYYYSGGGTSCQWTDRYLIAEPICAQGHCHDGC